MPTIIFLLAVFTVSVAAQDPAKPTSAPKPPQAIADRRVELNVGVECGNAEWSQFGPYMIELCKPIDAAWKRTLASGKIPLQSEKFAKVTFVLDSSGKVVRFVEITGNADAEVGKLCQRLVKVHAPYAKWTAEMVAVLGHEQTLKLIFFCALHSESTER